MTNDTTQQTTQHSKYIEELMDKEAERTYYPISDEDEKRKLDAIIDKYIDF